VTQLRAADAVLDRVYGKPRAAVEIREPENNRFDHMSIEEIERFLEGVDDQLRS
jgi:hypothetical protein